MRKSKVLSVVTSATLAASMLLTGCGSNDTPASTASSEASTASSEASTASSSETPAEESNLLPALSEAEQGKPGALSTPRSNYVQYPYEGAEGITLTYWMSVPSNVMNHPDTPDSVQMTEWAQRWQELTGITVEFIGPATTKSDEVTTAFNLMTTGDKLPDIIEWEWTSGYTGGPAQAEDDGVLIWLDDLITPDGPAADLWQFLQDNPSLDTAVKTDDGHYYTFPFTRGSKMLTTTSGPVVRADLLEAAGYKAEDLVTIDDWTAAMTAMQANGVEHPLSFESKSYMENLLPGAYGIRAAMYVSADDGKVHYGKMEEGYKEMLAQVVEWMNAGLIDPDTGEWTGANTKADILNGDSAICYGALGSRMGSWNTAAWAEPETYGADFELVGAQFPVKNAGQKVQYSGGSTDYATGSKAHAAITADCEYPEIAAAFLNFCYSQAGHYEINLGEEGVAYNGFEETSYGTAAKYSDTIMNADNIAVEMAHYGRANMSGAFVQDPAYILGYYATDQQKAAVSLWASNDVTGTILPPITMTPEESNEYKSLNSQVSTAVDEFRDKVLAGAIDINEGWDAYIEQIKGMGVERMIELQQAALDRYNAR
ncbi:MAG: hypothetical protein ACI4AB_06820 [Acetatifactor sp.]